MGNRFLLHGIRTQRGLNPAQFGQLLGLPTKRIFELEEGGVPTAPELQQIAQRLELDDAGRCQLFLQMGFVPHDFALATNRFPQVLELAMAAHSANPRVRTHIDQLFTEVAEQIKAL
jgi:transcriptional regulator with XRE-family HTH domain